MPSRKNKKGASGAKKNSVKQNNTQSTSGKPQTQRRSARNQQKNIAPKQLNFSQQSSVNSESTEDSSVNTPEQQLQENQQQKADNLQNSTQNVNSDPLNTHQQETQQPQEQTEQTEAMTDPVGVRVPFPQFKLDDIEAWFRRVEFWFTFNKVTREVDKFTLIASQIDNTTVSNLDEMLNPGTENQYTKLKEKIIKTFETTTSAKINKLLV